MSKNAKSESPMHMNIKAIEELMFLIPGTKKVFNQLN